MKKVLIISTHFAPDAHIGAKRPTKICKFLLRNGWLPVVLTKSVESYQSTDQRLQDNIPSNVKVFRVKEWDNRIIGFLLKMASRLVFFEYIWLFSALLISRKIAKKEDIDLIFSTSPDHDAHIVAMFLKLFLRKKWVCDFRDPWTFSFRTINEPRNKLESMLHRWFEKRILSLADCVTVAGKTIWMQQKKFMPNILDRKINVIYNGYDKEDFDCQINRVEGNGKSLRIIYTGSWGTFRTPEFFIKGLGNFVRNNKDSAEKIKVIFIGDVRYPETMKVTIKNLIVKEGLDKIIECDGHRNHKETLRELKRADVALLIEGSVIGNKDLDGEVVSAKFFEYLYAKKPILALIPPERETAKLMNQCNAGYIVPPRDVSAIEKAIKALYEQFNDCGLQYCGKLSEIKKFDRESQIKQFASIFNSLIAKG